MVTIIFMSEEGEAVSISFSRNDDLDKSHRYGRWHADTNSVELNDDGWRIFEQHRKEVRKLKPLLEMLEKL